MEADQDEMKFGTVCISMYNTLRHIAPSLMFISLGFLKSNFTRLVVFWVLRFEGCGIGKGFKI